MIRLSIQTRQGVSRLILPLLVALSCGLLVVSQVDQPLAASLRGALADRLVPVYLLLHRPVEAWRKLSAEAASLVRLEAENRRLRAENDELHSWYRAALALADENRALKTNLHWLPDPEPRYVTTRAVADTGGIYGRAVLLAAGSEQGLRKNQVAVDADGLVGRISEVGARSARVLLITDLASHVPVTLDGSHVSAMLVGSNALMPRLMYYPDEAHPEEGERVVTSSEAGAFPAGLPVGVVHYVSPHEPVVLPAAHLDRVDLLRIFDYGLSDVVPPEVPGHVVPGTHGRAAPGGRPPRARPPPLPPAAVGRG